VAPPHLAQLAQRRLVLGQVGDEHQHLHDVLGGAAGRAQRRQHVAGRHVELLDQRVTADRAVGGERRLPTEVHDPAGSGHHGVGVADRPRQLRCSDDLVAHRPLQAGLRPSAQAA
jgi:hypothetical protein